MGRGNSSKMVAERTDLLLEGLLFIAGSVHSEHPGVKSLAQGHNGDGSWSTLCWVNWLNLVISLDVSPQDLTISKLSLASLVH